MDAVVAVEIPKGERNKYEVDHASGEVWLDRTPRWQQVRDLEDVDQFLLDEISQFFEVHKLLEPGTHARIEGWRDRAAAERELQAAFERAASG